MIDYFWCDITPGRYELLNSQECYLFNRTITFFKEVSPKRNQPTNGNVSLHCISSKIVPIQFVMISCQLFKQIRGEVITKTSNVWSCSIFCVNIVLKVSKIWKNMTSEISAITINFWKFELTTATKYTSWSEHNVSETEIW